MEVNRYEAEIDIESDTTHARVVRLVGPGKNVLELGCSTGYMSRVLRERGCRVTGVEMDLAAAAQAAEVCDRIITGDCERIDWERELGEERFDVILAADVLEHLKDPLALLRRLRPFLTPDGSVVASIPNIGHGSVRLSLFAGRFPYSETGLLDRTHLRFFTRDSMEQLFADAGFLMARLERREADIDGTELPVDRSLIPQVVWNAIASDPEARTYQFILSAVPVSVGVLTLTRQRVEEALAERDAARAEALLLRVALDERGVCEGHLEAEEHRRIVESIESRMNLQREQLRTEVTERDSSVRDLREKLEETTAARQSDRLRTAEEIASFRAQAESALEDAARLRLDNARFREELAATKAELELLRQESMRERELLQQESMREAELLRQESMRETELVRQESMREAELLRQESMRETELLQTELKELRQILTQKNAEHETVVAELARNYAAEQEQLVARLTRDHAHALETVRSALYRGELDLGTARGQLLAIYHSKLWKAGHAYWRVLSLFGAARRHGLSVDPSSLILSCPSCGKVIPLLPRREESFTRAMPGSIQILPPADDAVARSNVVPFTTEGTLKSASLRAENRHDVLCFPIIDWDFRFQRPQQLMRQFAAAGHRVFYVSQRFRSSGRPFELRDLGDGVCEVSLRGPAKNIYKDSLSKGETKALFSSVDALRRDLSVNAAISVVQLPFWTPVASMAREELSWPLVYDCMDHHSGFSTSTSATPRFERELLTKADLVVTSSAFLEERARTHNNKVILVRNGCEFDRFAAAVRSEMNQRPVIGYYGAIADWFDSELVADIAESSPHWDFILVGSTHLADTSRLSRLPNVSLLGEKHYEEIPDWLAKFDVAIIPFKRIPLTEATNPVKVYEMLAAGKPVVSVPIPEVEALAPLVRLASGPREFAEEIRNALEERDPAVIEKRRQFASQNTWASRYRAMAPKVDESFPRASIIVVTYNNLEMNRKCLETLYATMDWPNFEVFVVDNASSDGTVEYLRGISSSYRNLTVILNNRNSGFAAANNQAMMLASGEYIVLLNNDTVLSRGWLSALIRHLHREPDIGLIGPSTNAIGNEAMVDIEYTDVETMRPWIEEYVRRHDGEVFDISMLAMFCIAMRRDVFEKVGFLDEQFGIGMFEDDDYAHRVRQAGLRVVCARDAFVHHWMKASFSKMDPDEYQHLFQRNRALFEAKWRKRWVPHKRA
ncbi:MAG TPA: glycosyltransferase [Thermoanaerobaculia bacterium]|nr:glycosyltransferase [Thermoanaerobaculia bacterium]